jgi:hypothetical protein
LGPAGIALAVGWDITDSTRSGRDAPEVIRDFSGNESLADKQKALAQEWMAWDHNRKNWGAAQYLQLFQETLIVEQEADKAAPKSVPINRR